MRPTFALLAATAWLTGCATAYVAPTAGPTASITFLAAADEMFGLGQNLALVDGEACQKPLLMAGFHGMSSERAAAQTVPAGNRLYLKAFLNNSRGYPTMRSCTNLVSFVPAEGARYTAQQRMVGESCALVLSQGVEKGVPPSLQIHDARTCR